jgi:hypothetical protein
MQPVRCVLSHQSPQPEHLNKLGGEPYAVASSMPTTLGMRQNILRFAHESFDALGNRRLRGECDMIDSHSATALKKLLRRLLRMDGAVPRG